MLRRCNGEAPSAEGQPADGETPTVFAWPSVGRRRGLVDIVEGFARNAADASRKATLLVSFDAEEADIDPLVLKGLGDIPSRWPHRFRATNLADRRRFLDTLPPGVDREVAAFALLPDSSIAPAERGASRNRNAIFLSAAGKILVSTDDDILCRPASRPGVAETVSWTDNPFPMELRFCPDRDDALAFVREKPTDIAGSHRRFLGKKAAEILTGEGIPGDAAERIVLATCGGCYGDSGLGRARTVLTLKDRARAWMIESGYERVRYTRELVRIPDAALVGPSMQFMAGHSGYDLRHCLPPFFPCARNEDGLFGMLVRVCYPASLTAYPDYGLLHDPPEVRSFDRESLVAFRPNMSEIVMALTLACMPDPSTREPRARMADLGRRYADSARLKTREFIELSHETWSRGAFAYAEILEGLLEEYGREPAQWRADAEELLGNVYRAIREPNLMYGMTGCGVPAETLARMVGKYGNLLQIWGEIFDHAARANRAEGE